MQKKYINHIHPDTHYKKQELDKQINERFDKILGEYDKELTGNENADLELFARKNGEWKQFCYKISLRQRLTRPNVFAFQNKIRNRSVKVEVNGEEKNTEGAVLNE